MRLDSPLPAASGIKETGASDPQGLPPELPRKLAALFRARKPVK